MIHHKDECKHFLHGFKYFQKLEKALANKLNLAELKSGIQIIRDTNGWRENEKSINYIWIVIIERSFIGWGGLFSIQFNENKFREHTNQKELLNGIFMFKNDEISQIYTDSSFDTTYDVTQFFKLNVFEANNDIALDGVSYTVRIIAPNIDTFIQLNNPNTEEWKKWETEIWTIGKKLAKGSKNLELISLFE